MRELGQDMMGILKVDSTLSLAFRVFSLICALLVVMIHVPVDFTVPSGWWYARVFHAGICGVSIPFFFFAAGFFLAGHCKEDGWWLREVRKRCKSLLIPYVSFGCAYAAIVCGLVFFSNDLYDPSRTSAENFAYVLNPLNILGLIPTDRPVLRLLWFVRGLFVFVLLSPLVLLAAKRWYGLGMLTLGCFFGVKLMCAMGLPLEFAAVFDMGALPLCGLFHFAAGMFMRSHEQVFVLSLSMPIVLMSVGMLMVICMNIVLVSGWSDSLMGGVGNLILYLGGLGLLVKYSISLPTFLLSCSFPVYLVHRFLLLPIRLVYKILTGSAKISWCCHFVTSLVLFCLSVYFVLLVRRFMPKTSKLLFGGR